MKCENCELINADDNCTKQLDSLGEPIPFETWEGQLENCPLKGKCECQDRCMSILSGLTEQILNGCDEPTRALMVTINQIRKAYKHPKGFIAGAMEQGFVEVYRDKRG